MPVEGTAKRAMSQGFELKPKIMSTQAPSTSPMLPRAVLDSIKAMIAFLIVTPPTVGILAQETR